MKTKNCATYWADDRGSALRNKATGRSKAIKKDIKRLMRLRPRRSHLLGGAAVERRETRGMKRKNLPVTRAEPALEDSSSRDIDPYGEVKRVAATREKNGYISDGWIQTIGIVRPLPWARRQCGINHERQQDAVAIGRYTPIHARWTNCPLCPWEGRQKSRSDCHGNWGRKSCRGLGIGMIILHEGAAVRSTRPEKANRAK